MNLLDIVNRKPIPEPWVEGEKIPWDDPAFSQRMLKEHLSQEHNAASRRFEIIDRHVDWIHAQVLCGQPARILDLGCGPGLYTSRLARRGHTCTGIDFAPASIAYASAHANKEALPCSYILEDIRLADYGSGYGLVMSIFGEFNVFRANDARKILHKSYQALAPGGLILLEAHTYEAIQNLGESPSTWYTRESGLFSEGPYLCLQENFWDKPRSIATQRLYILDASTAEVQRHADSMQAYTDEDYRDLLIECGFGEVTIYPSLLGEPDDAHSGLFCLVAHKSP